MRELLEDGKTRQARANARLGVLVHQRYEQIDQVHEDLLARPGAPQPTCAKGCAHCCQFIIYCEAAEAQLVIDRYPKEVGRAIPAMRRQQRRLAEVTTPEDRIATLVEGDQQALARVAGAWADLYEPCALLDPETQLCTIYDARPHPCRTYFVVSDPANCAVKHGGAQVLDVGGTRIAGHAALLSELGAERGGTLRMGTFVDLMIEAWDKRT
jgi:Fe-S-cluster containining protein